MCDSTKTNIGPEQNAAGNRTRKKSKITISFFSGTPKLIDRTSVGVIEHKNKHRTIKMPNVGWFMFPPKWNEMKLLFLWSANIRKIVLWGRYLFQMRTYFWPEKLNDGRLLCPTARTSFKSSLGSFEARDCWVTLGTGGLWLVGRLSV